MASYLFTSHDGFGLGHVRRNVSIAEAILRRQPGARITILTGIANDVPWLRRDDMVVVRVPSLVKDDTGTYRNATFGWDAAISRRSEVFDDLVRSTRPDVVVVDRHPFGVAGELRPGLESCRDLGIATVLGLRDILDDAPTVWAELASERWHGAGDLFDRVVVYGARHVCDHVAEYGLPMEPYYTGWVLDGAAEPPSMAASGSSAVDDRLLVIAAGGGGDGARVREVGVELIRSNADWRGIIVAGPLAERVPTAATDRLDQLGTVESCRTLLSRAGASVQMAGYNTTVEALAAGVRPILVPRRHPRREQAIRATRLTALGLADVVDEAADADEVSWLLHRPRRLRAGALGAAGISLDGASRTARLLAGMARGGRRVTTAAVIR